jgi:hypothetical protein
MRAGRFNNPLEPLLELPTFWFNYFIYMKTFENYTTD